MPFKRRNRRPSAAPRINPLFKEVVGIMKDTLDVTWRLAPIAIIPPGLMVWMYLKSIHWTSVFYESATTGSGLIFLALASLFVFVGVAVTFIAPSFLVMSTAAIYSHDEKIPQQVVSQYRWALAGWLLGSPSIGFNRFVWLLVVIPITFSAGRGLYLLYRSWTPLPTCRARMLKIGKTLGIGGLASLAMSWQVFPISLCLKLMQHLKEQSDLVQLMIVGACILLSTVSILPGFMYLHFRTLHTGALKSMRALLIGVLLTIYVAFSAMAMFAPVSAFTLSVAGVYSNEIKTFQILKPDLINTFSVAGIAASETNKTPVVAAYARYQLAGFRLLCKEKYEPAAEPLLEKTTDLAAAGHNCVPVKTDEVREFSVAPQKAPPK